MKSVTKYLSCHGLTLITGIILGVVITLSCIYRNELLCLLTSYNFWSGLGAMLAGLGTVCLFILAFIKSDEWLKQREVNTKDEVVLRVNQAIYELKVIKFLTDRYSGYIEKRKEFSELLLKFTSEVIEVEGNEVSKLSDHRDSDISDLRETIDRYNEFFLNDVEHEITNHLSKAIELISEANSFASRIGKSLFPMEKFDYLSDIYRACIEDADLSGVDQAISALESGAKILSASRGNQH